MHPTVFEMFGLRLPSYTVMMVLAFLVCTFFVVRAAKRLHLPMTLGVGVYVFFGALLGAKVFWILQYAGPGYLWHALFLWEEGLVFYGGLVGGVMALLAYCHARKLPVQKCGDVAAPFLALGEAIVRVGCFLNGCCWGGLASVPWAVRFPKYSLAWLQQLKLGLINSSAPQSLPVHPTQIYMTVSLVLVFLLLLVYSRRKAFDGAVVLAYLFLYGMVRYAVEIFRNTGFGGDSTGSVFGMTVSQTISLAMVLGSSMLYLAVISGVRGRKGNLFAPSERK